MTPPVNTTLSLPNTLLTQVDQLAHTLKLSRDELVQQALERFLHMQNQTENARSLTVHQGEIYWLEHHDPHSAEAAIPHPHVVIQDNVLNRSRLTTVIVCALTSNLRRASLPGNVLLDVGEANLLKQSVVEVSKVLSVEKMRLGALIGTLSEHRLAQILAGMRFLQTSFFDPS